MGKELKMCGWQMEQEDYSLYNTACGHLFQFTEGDPTDNHFKFCPYCGGNIEVKHG